MSFREPHTQSLHGDKSRVLLNLITAFAAAHGSSGSERWLFITRYLIPVASTPARIKNKVSYVFLLSAGQMGTDGLHWVLLVANLPDWSAWNERKTSFARWVYLVLFLFFDSNKVHSKYLRISFSSENWNKVHFPELIYIKTVPTDITTTTTVITSTNVPNDINIWYYIQRWRFFKKLLSSYQQGSTLKGNN